MNVAIRTCLFVRVWKTALPLFLFSAQPFVTQHWERSQRRTVLSENVFHQCKSLLSSENVSHCQNLVCLLWCSTESVSVCVKLSNTFWWHQRNFVLFLWVTKKQNKSNWVFFFFIIVCSWLLYMHLLLRCCVTSVYLTKSWQSHVNSIYRRFLCTRSHSYFKHRCTVKCTVCSLLFTIKKTSHFPHVTLRIYSLL